MVESEQGLIKMDEGLNYLQTFNPIESKAELLEKTLIGRKELVDLLEKLVIESATSGNKHQRLIIGPRGSGKTHLLRVLYNRLSSRSDVKDKLEIAYLCEDEYGIAAFLDFIIRIFRAFIKWDPKNSNYLNEEINKLKKVPINDQEKIAVKILLNHIKGKTLLVIAENISSIFDGIEKEGQRKLRDLVQQYPYFTFMASNQALFKDVQYEDKPFHNFFKITHLKKLTLEAAILFLKSIAEWEEKADLLKFLDEPEGKGRIHAIYDITGGNHRLLVTFYNFLKVDYKNRLSYSFIKTINDLIPYYQSFMNQLSAQQQKIVQYLCQIRKPSNVKNIAENCFSSQNTISKQMSTLEKLKYVDSRPSGKETFYELSEPLLRICFEVKENRGGPVKLFIDFLGNLYSVQEIKKRYMQYHILSKISQEKTSVDFYEEQRYYKETLRLYFLDKLENFKMDEFEKTGKDYQVKTYIEELEKTEAYSEILEFTAAFQQKDRYLLLKEAAAYGKTGEIEKEIEAARALLRENRKNIEALLLLAKALQKNKEFKRSDEYFNKVLNFDEKNIDAMNGLGRNLLLQDKYEEAERYFIDALTLEPDNVDFIENVGKAVGDQNRHQDAYNYFKKLITLKPEYSFGWTLLGQAQYNLEKTEEAKASFLKAIELDEEISSPIEYLGILLGKQGDIQQAYKYFERLTKLLPEYSEGWRLLGWAQENLKNIEEATKSYLKAIELDKENASAVEALGILLGNQGGHKQAYNYFKKLTDLAPEYSEGWRLLGDAQYYLKKIEDTEKSYLKAIELDKENTSAIKSLGILLGEQGDIEKAHKYFETLTKLLPDYSEGWRLLGWVQKNIKNYKVAMNNYLKAIEIDEENASAIKALGILLGEKGDFQQAHNYFETLTKLVPEYSEGWRLLGWAQEKLKNKEEAKKSYLKAIELDKENTNAIEYMGILLGEKGDIQQAHKYFETLTKLLPDYSEGWRLLGWAQDRLKDIEDAKNSYLKAIELNKENSGAIQGLGLLFGNLGDHQKAYNYFKKLTKLQASYSNGWYFLGQAQYNLEIIEEATKSYLKAIELDKENANAVKALGILLSNQGDEQQAYNHFKKLTDLAPEYSDGWRLLGDAQYNLKKIEDAEKSYLKAIELDKGNAKAIEDLGILLGEQGDIQQANKYFERLTKLVPDYSEGWTLLGWAKEKLKNIEEAKKSYLKAIELDKENASAVKALGILLGNQGDHQQAYNHFKKLTDLAPEYSEGWGLLGWAQARAKKTEEAKSSYLKAIDLDKNNITAFSQLAILLKDNSEFEKALNYIDLALNQNPENADFLNTKGEIYRESNQFEKAIPFYEKAIKIDPKLHLPYFNLVSCLIALNDISKALSQLKIALEVSRKIKTTYMMIQSLEENLSTLLIRGSQENISRYLKEALLLIEKYDYSEQFFKAIPQSIFEILIQHEEIEMKRFEFIETILNETFKENESMIVPLKFLNIGIRHLKKNEKNVLFQFTKEERNTFKKFVLDKIE